MIRKRFRDKTLVFERIPTIDFRKLDSIVPKTWSFNVRFGKDFSCTTGKKVEFEGITFEPPDIKAYVGIFWEKHGDSQRLLMRTRYYEDLSEKHQNRMNEFEDDLDNAFSNFDGWEFIGANCED